MHKLSVPFPFANLVFLFDDELIHQCYWSKSEKHASNHPLAKTIRTQCDNYLRDFAFQFDLPLNAPRSEFEKKYRKLMTKLKPGQLYTYQEIANKLQSHPRAIGQVSRRNPFPVIIPCHRIVGQRGLCGYAGSTEKSALQEKQWLLLHEGIDRQSVAL